MSNANVGGNELLFGAVSPTTTDHIDNDSYIVTDDGTVTGTPLEFWKFDGDTQAWVMIPTGGTTCPEPMTRTQLLALAGSYDTSCHYVITDYNRGTVGAAVIELHAVDVDTLSMDVHVKTTHDNVAWDGRYDINTNRMVYLADNLDNEVTGQTMVDAFPWGNTSVVNNRVLNGATLNYTSGNMDGNTFGTSSVSVINGANFIDNEIGPESNVNYSGTGVFARNTILNESSVTVSSGDFRENTVSEDATVTSSTSGDVENNAFRQLSNTTVSGTANVDTCTVDTDGNLIAENANVTSVKIEQEGNLTIRGGSLQDSTIEQDAQVVLYGGSHYENRWGTSVVFNQVDGTSAYVRYSSFDGITTWTHGGVNLSNVESYVTTANTTGSIGTISNSHFHRAYCPNLQNITSLTITDFSVTSYAQISASGASRLYLYRGTLNNGRVLVTAGAELAASYPAIDSYGYIQVTAGVLTANYCTVSSLGYIQHTSTGSNRIEGTLVSGQSNARFLGTTNNCRIYYCNSLSGASLYHNGASSGCYMYYCGFSGNAQLYTNDSVNARIYYSSGDSRGRMYSNGNTATHYMYYCKTGGNSMLEMRTCSGSQMYSVDASAQSIVRLQNSTAAGRLYNSSITAYYYLYVTLTATRSGLHAYGRRTNTVTNPSNGTSTENFL